jgi:DNA-binding response OmpR family regulator
MRILIAEDDEPSRMILAGQLTKLGHEVDAVEDGQQAWEHFLARQPEVVITDWQMPNLDGLQLCRRIRSHPAEKYAYLIVLTALDGKVGYLEGMNAGADDFVSKPCDTVDLNVRLRVAERILSLQQEVQQLEGLLPICPNCKKIRDEADEWQPVEAYISRRTDAQFSHGICPQCYETIMKPQLEELRRERK